MSHEGFFYNVTSKSCEKFLGTSCPRNMDTYSSLKECIQFCSGTDFCDLPPDHGSCDLKLQRWFYDPKTKDCEIFTFGGCKGNLNNFNSQWRCRLVCRFRGPS
ncbi:BPTI/Kunitz domain-containing protein-like [Ahaetulla prasina]|uniref:BPTI/Kunitz domain-containing protein-like n=1 Tax=Ahaetulla prasina TaxID=499056 RepID=UPI0026486A92|nr:BPTI/Kunitz domain-containing protein-like [Ahaetulla prasina]